MLKFSDELWCPIPQVIPSLGFATGTTSNIFSGLEETLETTVKIQVEAESQTTLVPSCIAICQPVAVGLSVIQLGGFTIFSK